MSCLFRIAIDSYSSSNSYCLIPFFPFLFYNFNIYFIWKFGIITEENAKWTVVHKQFFLLWKLQIYVIKFFNSFELWLRVISSSPTYCLVSVFPFSYIYDICVFHLKILYLKFIVHLLIHVFFICMHVHVKLGHCISVSMELQRKP